MLKGRCGRQEAAGPLTLAAPPARGVMPGLVPLERLGGYAGVLADDRTDVCPGPGHQHGRAGVILRVVSQRRVAELIQGPVRSG